MIRYPVTRDRLEEMIKAEAPTWLRRAGTRTKKFREAGRYTEEKGIWSEVKPIYVRLQHNKCAFCERRLSGPEIGLLEYDLEHFRPKSEVKAWPTDEIRERRKIRYDFPTGGAREQGYHLLAYHPWNYLAACKPCNTALKSSFFPILGERIEEADDPWQLSTEKAYLVYPLGELDEDPTELLTFVGSLPIPRYTSGHQFRRASVMIDFFELDTREDLLLDRATWITAHWMALYLRENGNAASQRVAEQRVREHLSPLAPHSNCLQAFHQLALTDPTEAESIALKLSDYLASKLPRTADAA
ncbi:MAG TPA: hypothetical protein VHG28_13310 [Longimicrobiaceae bacterium]|nr:hypothetical protein [Longimicrobiaceae bacterium]